MKKICARCKNELPLDKFYKNNSAPDKLNYHCIECDKKSREKRIDKIRIYAQKYRKDNREKLREWDRVYRRNNPEKERARAIRYIKEIKEELFINYGGCYCKCCGEKEISFLTLDHVKNNGAEERKSVFGAQRKAGYHFYIWLKNNGFPRKEDYQVLCMNCQFGKQQNNGICPHQKREKK